MRPSKPTGGKADLFRERPDNLIDLGQAGDAVNAINAILAAAADSAKTDTS